MQRCVWCVIGLGMVLNGCSEQSAPRSETPIAAKQQGRLSPSLLFRQYLRGKVRHLLRRRAVRCRQVRRMARHPTHRSRRPRTPRA